MINEKNAQLSIISLDFADCIKLAIDWNQDWSRKFIKKPL